VVSIFRHGEVELAYDEFGSVEAEPLLLLSGLGSSRRQWHPFVRELADRHRVFSLDHRGHGGSSHAPATSYTLAHYGADALAFGDEVLRRPAVLVGHSLGGAVAHYVACSRPELVRGLFLVDPPCFPGRTTTDGRFRGTSPASARHCARPGRTGATAQEYAAALRSLPPPAGQAVISDVLSDEVLHGMAQEQLWLDPEIFTPPIEGTAFHGLEPTRRISCPVAVLRGDPGKMAAFTADDERRFRTVNPHASVHVVPGAGHVIHADAPEEFTERLTGFLRSLK
jgi:pimeloyl-ACP methyl ester carboxylesterase